MYLTRAKYCFENNGLKLFYSGAKFCRHFNQRHSFSKRIHFGFCPSRFQVVFVHNHNTVPLLQFGLHVDFF